MKLLAQRLSMQFARESRNKLHATAFPVKHELRDRFLDSLPFPLTNAQQRVVQEISLDLAQSKPMLRLVQGDVGAGKNSCCSPSCVASHYFETTSSFYGAH